jgi:hypothetical protein
LPEWMEIDVQEGMDAGEDIEADVYNLSKPPCTEATAYKSMYAFGYHFRVATAEVSFKTVDSGVAAKFEHPWRSGICDRNPMVAPVEYVGYLKEILEVNYRTLCVTVLVCRWTKANYRGPHATIRKDKWGFTLANFDSMLPLSPEAFALPAHITQVIYCDARELPG